MVFICFPMSFHLISLEEVFTVQAYHFSLHIFMNNRNLEISWRWHLVVAMWFWWWQCFQFILGLSTMSSFLFHLRFLGTLPMHVVMLLAGIDVPSYFLPWLCLYYIRSLIVSPIKCSDATTSGLIKVRPAYAFGVDPKWHGSRSELPFLNSLKMKMSILLGVAQMNLGIMLSYFNAKFFRNSVNVW